jgi:biopolymer transport protein ExbB/TolQ
MQILIETLMYQLGQIFLLPTLALIALLFLYSCYSLGGFAVQAWQRRNGGGRPLLTWWCANRSASADELDVRAHKLMEAARIATRIAPMLGLVATMIPMGPAMKSLSDGNLGAVSENLMVAFSAVILALIAASATYLVVNVRRRWLAEEMLDIEKLRKELA